MQRVGIIVGGVVFGLLGLLWGDMSANAYSFPNADVFVEWSGGSSVVRGESVSYSLLVRSNGPDDAQGVFLSIIPPADFQFDWRQSTSGCSGYGVVIECRLGRVTSSQSRPIRLTFFAPERSSCVSEDAQIRATIRSETNDPNGNNNSATSTTRIFCKPGYEMSNGTPVYLRPYYTYYPYSYYPDYSSSYSSYAYSYPYYSNYSYSYPYSYRTNADLGIGIVGPTSVTRGDIIGYTVTVRNNSSETAYGVSVDDVIPDDFQFASSASDSSCYGGNTVTCNLGTIPAYQYRIFRIAFTIPHRSSCVTMDVQNRVTVRFGSDAYSANNTSAFTTRVLCSSYSGGSSSSSSPTIPFSPTWGGGLDDLTHPIFLNIGTQRKYRAEPGCRENCL